MTAEAAERMLEQSAHALGEHFGSVQIMATWDEYGITKCSYRGAGNWYARQGMAHEFINHDIAQDSAKQIAEQLKEEPPAEEEWKKV